VTCVTDTLKYSASIAEANGVDMILAGALFWITAGPGSFRREIG
jgi:hypothetical protein